MKPGAILVVVFFVCLAAFLVYWLLLIKLWMRAVLAGAPIPLQRLLGMRLRKAPAADIVDAYIAAHKTGVTVSVDELETHALAGGSAPQLVAGMAIAAQAGISLSYRDACAIDLAGRDVVEEARACQASRTLWCPDALDPDKTLDAVSADGVRLKAKAAMTVRPRLALAGGARLSGPQAEMVDTIKAALASPGSEGAAAASEAIAQALEKMPLEPQAPRPTLASAAVANHALLVERVANAIKNVVAGADARSALDAPETVAQAVRQMRVDEETALQIVDIEVTIEEADTGWQY